MNVTTFGGKEAGVHRECWKGWGCPWDPRQVWRWGARASSKGSSRWLLSGEFIGTKCLELFYQITATEASFETGAKNTTLCSCSSPRAPGLSCDVCAALWDACVGPAEADVAVILSNKPLICWMATTKPTAEVPALGEIHNMCARKDGSQGLPRRAWNS